jgi:hypothetical protein
LDVLPVAAVRLVDFWVLFFAGFLSAITKHLLTPVIDLIHGTPIRRPRAGAPSAHRPR